MVDTRNGSLLIAAASELREQHRRIVEKLEETYEVDPEWYCQKKPGLENGRHRRVQQNTERREEL